MNETTFYNLEEKKKVDQKKKGFSFYWKSNARYNNRGKKVEGVRIMQHIFIWWWLSVWSS
jgi:hypothetical protein